jgi:phenylacetate-CoA ligase
VPPAQCPAEVPLPGLACRDDVGEVPASSSPGALRNQPARRCPCGRSFALLTGIEGRVEDVRRLPGTTGEVSIHPNVFHNVLDEATIAGWQVIHEPTSLRVMLAGLAASASAEQVSAGVEAALESAGVVGTDVDVRVVDAVEHTAPGKAPLVRGLRNRP